ncbi:MAG: ribonuclease G [Gallionellales bacterium RIFCSPLOWO2_12_FULL_59_22]|nr:MAG: ribonuclease G [Gallionellales bacterium RIFCSPLOWO2_02_FULL_59_110]OGT03995.1 MAG: ribonuclease G [Gallionellales bacterium RIFCSPLOWO2_02_58_13]OGT13968.1 MAG: ribonuclease G [Gallionellales bacterium RIFCSPLOWO2_12_FULL_59_22]
MNEEILINVTPQETRVAVVQLGVVQDLHIERTSSCGIVSNVYLGKVKRVLPGMQSAFIDIGLERSAFLHVADIWENSNDNDAAKPIEKILFEGQTLLVQVIKEPIGSKGARLSTQISIAGRQLVYLPQETHIGVSQRIESAAQRDALRARLQAALPPDHQGGYIIRTAAETAADPDFIADIAYLDKLWHNLQNTVQSASAPQLLYQELNLSLRVLRDFVGTDAPRIQVDSRATYQSMLEFAQAYNPPAAERLEHYQGARPLFDLYGVEDEIERALAKRVDLKSGGYLIIDQTEALTTIDVNTGGFVGLRNFDDTIFKTNLEATQAIARQLRLRNLGGIIICDFIDMDTQEHRDAVLDEFKKALSLDHMHVTVNGFSSLGLVEMTRKRTRESLAHILCEPCPTCQGRGEVKTAQTVCYEILREILREARQFNAREYRILASQQVIDLFLEEESTALAQLSDFIAKPVSMQVETLYSQEQYDVILM